MQEPYKCVLCKEIFGGFGNNPWPLAEDGRCCANCNMLVIASRLEAHILKRDKADDR